MNEALRIPDCDADDGRRGCLTDEAKSVCLEVTLNNDPWQHSVQFVYYDM